MRLTLFTRVSTAAAILAVLAAGAALDPRADGPIVKGSPYPLPTCPVTNDVLPESPTILVMEDKENLLLDGREIRFCGAACAAHFKAEPQKFLPAIDAAIIEQQKGTYPLTHCLVMTDNQLPKPGEPDFDKVRDIVVLNEMIRTCCAGCNKKIKKDPLAYLAKLEDGVKAAQRTDYPLANCPVSGNAIDAESEEIVIGARLVKVCCLGCGDKARQNPMVIFAKLDSAAAAKARTNAPMIPAAPTTPATPVAPVAPAAPK